MCTVKIHFYRGMWEGLYPPVPQPQPPGDPALLRAGVRTLAPLVHLRPSGRKMMSQMFHCFSLILSLSFSHTSIFPSLSSSPLFKTSNIPPKLSNPLKQSDNSSDQMRINTHSHPVLCVFSNFLLWTGLFFPPGQMWGVWGSSPALANSRRVLKNTGY